MPSESGMRASVIATILKVRPKTVNEIWENFGPKQFDNFKL